MNILLLAAMDKEISLLTNLLSDVKVFDESGVKYWKGYIGNHLVYVSKCGIGKVNASLNTARLIKLFNPDIVINSGVAGGAGLKIGTVLVADKIAYHDVWCGPGTDYGQADGFPLYMKPSSEILNIIYETGLRNEVILGLICSGDKFITTPDEITFIRSKFPDVKAVDMESAAIAQTCMYFNKPFSIIRVVSDTPGEGENINQYKDFWKNAPYKTFNLISQILKAVK